MYISIGGFYLYLWQAIFKGLNMLSTYGKALNRQQVSQYIATIVSMLILLIINERSIKVTS